MSKDYVIVSSILNADLTRLGDVIREVEAAGVDWIQIDVMDGHFVPNLSFGPSIVEAIRKVTILPLDLHLMIEDPDRFLETFAEAGSDSITVHVEACPHLDRTLLAIRDLGLRAGVALKPETPASAVIEFLSLVDLVLVMTVDPGFAGQTFIPSTLSKIRQIHSLLEEIDPRPRIQVDGGITAETAPKAASEGADTFVAGSAILKYPEGIQAGVEALRNSLSTVTV
ncbi:MAG TPA: ribulose-phosphate 3-epimerase [Anaerolineae bacterium]|nr:MAG: ribulose phosphate epimerase [Anaerolineae bacterium SM23_ 63]HEY42891.1 ribulose-phosphate 3-epimerase [Anaerolineae bacterium]